jgi:hypothetical protein
MIHVESENNAEFIEELNQNTQLVSPIDDDKPQEAIPDNDEPEVVIQDNDEPEEISSDNDEVEEVIEDSDEIEETSSDNNESKEINLDDNEPKKPLPNGMETFRFVTILNDGRKCIQEFDVPVDWPTHTMVGNLQLPFPHFNIKPTFFDGKGYSAVNTCSLDSSLFLLYYIYKSNSEEFRSLFDSNISICKQLLKTFNLVEEKGWDIARIYWISTHSTHPDRNNNKQHHDLFATADTNVFQYVRELQKHVVKSTCTAPDCPELVQVKHSDNITMP